MAFSKEWEETYKTGVQNSIWPWSDVVSTFYHYFKGDKSSLRVLELGCGAGANIPFFKFLGVEYCGIEGSATKVKELNERYADEKITIIEGDFTKALPFDGEFNLILDRSSVTHNKTDDIKEVVRLSTKKLKIGGYYFGIDWFSDSQGSYDIDAQEYELIDDRTRVFHTGYFAGLGNVHFSDEKHIKDLFCDMELVELYEKVDKHVIPTERIIARWNFVARKP